MKNADGSDFTLQQLVAIIQHEIKHHEERKRRLELNQYSPLPASFWERDEPTFSKDMQNALHKLMVGFPNIGQPRKQQEESELDKEQDLALNKLGDMSLPTHSRDGRLLRSNKKEQDLALNKLGQMRARKHLFYVNRKVGKL